MASLHNPATVYAVLMVAAAALRETARQRTVIELLVNSLDPKAIDGQDEAIRDVLHSDIIGGSGSTDYLLVLATQLTVDAERIAIRSPAVRSLRRKLDPSWSDRHAPTAADGVRTNVSRETSTGGKGQVWREEPTDPGVEADSPTGEGD